MSATWGARVSSAVLTPTALSCVAVTRATTWPLMATHAVVRHTPLPVSCLLLPVVLNVEVFLSFLCVCHLGLVLSHCLAFLVFSLSLSLSLSPSLSLSLFLP